MNQNKKEKAHPDVSDFIREFFNIFVLERFLYAVNFKLRGEEFVKFHYRIQN